MDGLLPRPGHFVSVTRRIRWALKARMAPRANARRIALRTGVFCLFLWTFVGCGDDPESGPPLPGENDAGGSLPDVGIGPQDGRVDAGDVDGESDVDPHSSCDHNSTLDRLHPGDQGLHDIDFRPAHSDDVTCRSDDSGVAIHDLHFELSSASIVDWTIVSDGDAALSDRSDRCADDSPCHSGRHASLYHPPDSDQLLRVETTAEAHSATLQFEVREATCEPPGSGWCQDGEYHECYQGEHIDTYACAGSSCVDDHCGADSCIDAIELDPGDADDPAVVDGHRRGYTHTGHFDDLSECELDNITDERPELFVSIGDIPDDRLLVVENLAQGTYGFYVLADCEATRCLAVGSRDDSHQNRLQWSPDDTVEDAIIGIRPSDTVSRSFSFAIYFDEGDPP